MPVQYSLNITFTPVAGALGYDVCYKQTNAANYTCNFYSATGLTFPIVITTGIVCSVNYDVQVRAVCSEELSSEYVQHMAHKAECTPEFYLITNIGLGTTAGDACSSTEDSVYSHCAALAVNCLLYLDANGTSPLTGVTKLWDNGVLYDVDPTLGYITQVSAVQC
ncbi:MAG: hypothetical protein EBR30_03530 [Cytophagia bacterium]|nr:hypothetical protein [Cytophagia bacterium]NBW34084.1 hypothetical protein [Cytophagia bacterium]